MMQIRDYKLCLVVIQHMIQHHTYDIARLRRLDLHYTVEQHSSGTHRSY